MSVISNQPVTDLEVRKQSVQTEAANRQAKNACDHDTATTGRLILSEIVGEPHDHRCGRPYKDHAGRQIVAGAALNGSTDSPPL